ncbi:MAG: methylated-DNA--[protein]-cysteine S-methyltransferase [Hyphomicrobiales bacterium]
MNDVAYALFDTAIGRCAIVWGEAGIKALSLPEKNEARMRARIGRNFPDATETAPPPVVQAAIDRIHALLDGGHDDLKDLVLDMDGQPAFHIRVYELARAISPGETKTYGEIAETLGDKTLSRAVGQALGRNPWPIVVPCHRVLAANGGTGGFSADGGVDTKMRMLTIEGAGKTTEPQLFDALPLAAKPQR